MNGGTNGHSDDRDERDETEEREREEELRDRMRAAARILSPDR